MSSHGVGQAMAPSRVLDPKAAVGVLEVLEPTREGCLGLSS